MLSALVYNSKVFTSRGKLGYVPSLWKGIYSTRAVFPVASGQMRMTPENTAGVVGTSVVLQCQASVDAPPCGIFWYEYITSTGRTTIAHNGDITPGAPNSQLYSITGDSSVAQYHLNIELAFLSGGRYECYEGFSGFTALSHVTVLQSSPVCSDTIQADGVVEEGETITYTCEVVYKSTSIDWPPVMTWTGPDGAIPDVNKLSTSGGTVTSSVDVTGAPGLNGAVYSVRTHFEAYGGSLPVDHATNVPTYSHSRIFNALLVHYSPREIAFQPDGNTFIPGEQLTCSALGSPAVRYKWYNSSDSRTLADGAELTIKEEMDGLTCVCEAYNTIRVKKGFVSKEITLTVTKAPTSTTRSTPETNPPHPSGGPASTQPTTTETLTPCSGPTPGVVAGIVIAVILFLGLLVASVLVLLRKRKVPKEEGQNHPKFEEDSGEQITNMESSLGEYETPDLREIKFAPSEYEALSVPPLTGESNAIAEPFTAYEMVLHSLKMTDLNFEHILHKSHMFSTRKVNCKKVDKGAMIIKIPNEGNPDLENCGKTYLSDLLEVAKLIEESRYLVVPMACCIDVVALPVFEYHPRGTLKQLLQKQAEDTKLYENIDPWISKTPWMFVVHVARGLVCLHSAKVELLMYKMSADHVILAQQGTQLIAKLIGFASTARIQERRELERKKKILSMRWLAPEILNRQEHTRASDVWGFGMMLWEVASNGEIPYAATHDDSLLQKIYSGRIPEKPMGCNRAMYGLMRKCWQTNPLKRPSAENLVHATEILE